VFGQTSSENLLEDDRSSVDKSVIKTDERKDYNLKVLKYVQCIFAHLAGSKLQFYVPKGFWKHFRSVSADCYENIDTVHTLFLLSFFQLIVGCHSLSFAPVVTLTIL